MFLFHFFSQEGEYFKKYFIAMPKYSLYKIAIMKNKYLLYILLFLNSVIIAKAQLSCVSTPSVSVSITGLCAGKSELLTATPTSGGSTPFYTWKLNNVILPIFNNITTDAGLADNTINEVFVVGNNIYVATASGLSISTNAGSTFSIKTTTANGLGNNTVNGLFVTNTKIYAATAGGLSISADISGNTFTNKKTTNGLGSNIVNDVFVDGDNVYAATNSGLSISTDGGVSFTNKTIGIVRGIFVDGNNIYAATSTGLNISTDAGANFTLKNTTNGLVNNIVNDVYKVGSRIFIATSGGLSISSDNGSTFINKTTTNGLTDNNVSSVFAIGSFVYASTVNGLSLSNDNANTFFINKNTNDGLGTNTINYTFALGNNIYAATTGGLAIATINALQVNNAVAPDVYTVTMLPSTANCPSTTATVPIYRLPIPSIVTNSPVCTAMPLNLQASNERVNIGNTYSWSGPNAYTSTNQDLSFSATTVALSGTYSVTITDANGCTATTSVPVTVNPLPTPTIGSNSPICSGFSLNLTSTNTRITTGNTFAWTGPNSYTSSNQSPSITNGNTTMSGTYSVSITDANGCTATATTAVIVNPLPIPSVSSNSPICTAFTLNLTANNTGNAVGNSYAWTGPNSYTSTNQNPSFPNATVSLSGTYSVTITDANGCTATATTAVIVKSKPPVPVISVPSQLVVCFPNTLTLTANGCTGIVTWSDNSTGSNITLSTIGTYSLSAICTIDGCVSEVSSLITGLEIKVAPTAQASNGGPYIVGQTINLNASNGTNYSWTGPNNFTSLLSSPTIINATSQNGGIYGMTVAINGCFVTATTNVVVNYFAPCSLQRIVDYSYVKAGKPHQPLFPLSDGMILQQIPEQSSILVTPVCPTINIESFEMKIVGPELNFIMVQNVDLFALFNNEKDEVFGRNLSPGDYTLTVTGYSQDDRNGAIVYGPVVTTFKVVGALGTISIPTISSQSICAGSSIDVSFSTSGNFSQVSQFQVQLSDANGSFQNPTTIGTSNTTGTVSCFVPSNITEGTNYLIRVASSNQTAVGNPTMSAVTVNALNSNILQNILTGTKINKAVQTLLANNKIISPANVSYQAGKAISLNAGFEASYGSVFKAEIKVCN